jgi:hypothetical protein
MSEIKRTTINTGPARRAISLERSVLSETQSWRLDVTETEGPLGNDSTMAGHGGAPGGPRQVLPTQSSPSPRRPLHETRTVPGAGYRQSSSMSKHCDDHLASLYAFAYRRLGDHAAAAAAVAAAVAAAARLPAQADSASVPVWNLLATHFEADLDRFAGPRATPLAVADHQPHGPQNTAHSLNPRPALATSAPNASTSELSATPFSATKEHTKL